MRSAKVFFYFSKVFMEDVEPAPERMDYEW